MSRFRAGVMIGFGFCLILVSVSPILLYVLGEALVNPGSNRERLMKMLASYENVPFIHFILKTLYETSKGVYLDFRMNVERLATYVAITLFMSALAIGKGVEAYIKEKEKSTEEEKAEKKRTPRICQTCKYYVPFRGGVCRIYGPKKPDDKCKRWRKR